MKLIYKDEYLEDSYNKELNLLKSVFSTCSLMEEEEYKNIILAHLENMKQYKPSNFLMDISESEYVVNIELQKWMAINCFPINNEIGLKKWAIVASKDFIVSLSVEQVIDEYPSHTIDICYFYTEQEAMEWLLSN